ncbi:phosphate ABC transporter permease PstA [Actinokineospora auranticolor]|uniref:Phosphate transport system permease protein PstA n=1 Tax=Actinokineospora auranticolor TaxID=155976 RepID=A0A2S6GI81_9PSEU|nr:phosphate ABC transporter permease PstA [Actinokineospora auranticolor]PPK64866.1 phosphate transport system permease protein [Actinokineospora auranticolor]
MTRTLPEHERVDGFDDDRDSHDTADRGHDDGDHTDDTDRFPRVDEDEPRRVIRARGPADRVALIGSAAAGFALVWVVYQRLLPTSGLLGFAVCWYAAFLLVYTLVTLQRHGAVEVVDRMAAVVVRTGAALVGASLVLVIGYTIISGLDAMQYANFYTEELIYTDPADLRQGGILHAVVGTLEQLAISVAITLPLGIACAVYLTEVGGRLAKVVRTLIEAMTGLPSIVAGLFIYVAAIQLLGVQRSGFAAALALSVMMLPIITRSADVVLRLVPNGLREASLALGSSQWQTIWRVVLPTARPSLATALILGVARGAGETSPVLLTAGYSQFLNANPLVDWQTSLPLFVYQVFRLPDEAMAARAFGAATVLLLLVLLLFVIARLVARGKRGER